MYISEKVLNEMQGHIDEMLELVTSEDATKVEKLRDSILLLKQAIKPQPDPEPTDSGEAGHAAD